MALLQKLIHSSDDVQIEGDAKTCIITHIVNESDLGCEFTVCGRDITQSELKYNGWGRYGDWFNGSYKKCDCDKCKNIVNYYKHLK